MISNNLILLKICSEPRIFIVNSLIALMALGLFILWSKKKALLGFRAWALFMLFVHIFYMAATLKITAPLNIRMKDIVVIYFLEALTTTYTMLRFYFIIEAYSLEVEKIKKIDPLKRVTKSVKNAIRNPENPQKINGNAKREMKKQGNSLKVFLLDLLF